jgi:exosortase E/protease (VPEID-CTERM system)
LRDFSAVSAPVSSARETGGLGLVPRILSLAVLFAAELAVITILLDGDRLAQKGGLTGLVGHWGPLILRLIVGFAALFTAVAYLKSKDAMARISGQVAPMPVRWLSLAAHLAAMTAFGILSAGLYGGLLPGAPPDLLAIAWIISGLAGIVFAGLAVVPWTLWTEIVHVTGYAWAYSLIAILAASSAEEASRALWQPAARLTFGIVKLLLRPFVTVILADPVAMHIRTQHFGVLIAPECSGLEGAGLMLAFGVTVLWLFRKECRFPQCLILLPAGVVLLFLLNSVRIAALVLIGNAGARQIALGGFHSQAGWILFNSVALGLALAARRLPWFSTRQLAAKEFTESTENPTAFYLMPFLMVLAAGMIARAASGGFEWPYPLRFVAAAAALWFFRRKYAHLDWKFDWVAVAAGTFVFALWVGLDRILSGGTEGMPSALAAVSPAVRNTWIAIRILAAVVTVPITEELAFRGYLLRRLVASDFESVSLRGVHWLALLASSAAFGLLHGGRWFVGTAAGVLYALVQARRGRIGDAVAAHAISNALLAAYILVFQQWQFW